jgi:hypothetical protein
MRGISILILTGLLGAGCADTPAPQPERLESRLDAANALQNKAARDQAMRNLALDAADDQDADVTRDAVESINNPALRDMVAGTCARRFDSNHDRATAEKLVSDISNPKTRDDIHRQFAAEDR